MNYEESIKSNIDFVEYEIDIRIESLKIQLDSIGDMFHSRLNDLREKLKY
jgi:hypothetical protein